MDESESDFEIKLRDLRQTYLDRCRHRVRRARTWVGAVTEDIEAVQRLHGLAHEMAGSGATYGFPRISEVADRLERRLEPFVEESSVVEEHTRIEELRELIDRLDQAIPEAARA